MLFLPSKGGGGEGKQTVHFNSAYLNLVQFI